MNVRAECVHVMRLEGKSRAACCCIAIKSTVAQDGLQIAFCKKDAAEAT